MGFPLMTCICCNLILICLLYTPRQLSSSAGIRVVSAPPMMVAAEAAAAGMQTHKMCIRDSYIGVVLADHPAQQLVVLLLVGAFHALEVGHIRAPCVQTGAGTVHLSLIHI